MYTQQSNGEKLQFLAQRQSTSIMKMVLIASDWCATPWSGCPRESTWNPVIWVPQGISVQAVIWVPQGINVQPMIWVPHWISVQPCDPRVPVNQCATWMSGLICVCPLFIYACSPIKAKTAEGVEAAAEQADNLREERIPRSRSAHAGEHARIAPVPWTCSSRFFDPAPWILLLVAKHNKGGHRTWSTQHTKSSQGKCKQHCH